MFPVSAVNPYSLDSSMLEVLQQPPQSRQIGAFDQWMPTTHDKDHGEPHAMYQGREGAEKE